MYSDPASISEWHFTFLGTKKRTTGVKRNPVKEKSSCLAYNAFTQGRETLRSPHLTGNLRSRGFLSYPHFLFPLRWRFFYLTLCQTFLHTRRRRWVGKSTRVCLVCASISTLFYSSWNYRKTRKTTTLAFCLFQVAVIAPWEKGRLCYTLTLSFLRNNFVCRKRERKEREREREREKRKLHVKMPLDR